MEPEFIELVELEEHAKQHHGERAPGFRQ